MKAGLPAVEANVRLLVAAFREGLMTSSARGIIGPPIGCPADPGVRTDAPFPAQRDRESRRVLCPQERRRVGRRIGRTRGAGRLDASVITWASGANNRRIISGNTQGCVHFPEFEDRSGYDR